MANTVRWTTANVCERRVADSLPDIDQKLIGKEFERSSSVPITAEQLIAYARAYGETKACYVEDGPDLIATPTFPVSLRREKFVPEGIPIGLMYRGMDAGKEIELGVHVRVGDVLTGVGKVHDVYDKTGRSGNLRFLVLRMVISNQRDEMVAVIDQKMMFR